VTKGGIIQEGTKIANWAARCAFIPFYGEYHQNEVNAIYTCWFSQSGNSESHI